jgi:aconitate hydratase
MVYGVLEAHNTSGDMRNLKLRFDAMASHDITFVNIIQTAKVSGLTEFPIPYILTNCHNSLCAVGGTINSDDHVFGLQAARKYGGVFVPPHLAVIHSYVREKQAGCGSMILGSDSHTRYGALGALGVGEGGGELVKQLLRQTYDIAYPKVIAVYLTGKVQDGVGPQDVSLSLIGAVFKSGFVKNAALEFIGPGIAGLSADFRCGVDVMTTETTCWSSLWETDGVIQDYLALHGRADDYRPLSPGPAAYYDGLIKLDLSTVKPMIALPFHPSNTWEIDTFLENPGDILREIEIEGAKLLDNPKIQFNLTGKVDRQGRVSVDQGIIAGCAGGTYENIMAAAAILDTSAAILDASAAEGGNPGFSLSVYPGSQPILLELTRNGAVSRLISAGAVVRSAFCGPCFGAGDVPPHEGLSIRHTTRNFPNREGSKPGNGQIASVCLMDARSIAATARNGGCLCSAASFAEEAIPPYHYDDAPYRRRVFTGTARPDPEQELRCGPNITGWPDMDPLGENLLLKIVSFITDPVTTTDEIIPSGETSSYRSNPVGLAEFTLSRKDPAYVERAKATRQAEITRRQRVAAGMDAAESAEFQEFTGILSLIRRITGFESIGPADIQLASAIYAVKPGDGSAREQAASCQRVLGGAANFAQEYATKRYRSNLINWGLIPFVTGGEPPFKNGDCLWLPGIAKAIREGTPAITAYVVNGSSTLPWKLAVPELGPEERQLLLQGSLINYNRSLLTKCVCARAGN